MYRTPLITPRIPEIVFPIAKENATLSKHFPDTICRKDITEWERVIEIGKLIKH